MFLPIVYPFGNALEDVLTVCGQRYCAGFFQTGEPNNGG
ncbi:hypothetical protein BTN49_2728 [Candidatus Enterovibrio escicola]|uniref:Uncharacterized protein n=1 Tax=Candidatus Enterovibrio escicola TaxID=1927127 RepID=A0A2A5T0P2_9GAMM|nr:hypothetical protein BTN49_2728 [Candidatus Enterovibrio escacola]